jgi:hypothetical protein
VLVGLAAASANATTQASSANSPTTVNWNLHAPLQYTPDEILVDEDFANSASIAEASTSTDEIDVLNANQWVATPSDHAHEPLRLDLGSSEVRPRIEHLDGGVYVVRSGADGAIGLIPKGKDAHISVRSPPTASTNISVSYDLLVPNALDGIQVSLYSACLVDSKTTLVDDVKYVPQLTRVGVRRISRHLQIENPCAKKGEVVLSWVATAAGSISAGFLARVSMIGAELRPTIAHTTVVGDETQAPFLRNAFAAAVREVGLFNVITCKDDTIDEDSLVRPISDRGWANTTQAGDRGTVLARLTAIGCRLPPYNRVFAIRVAVGRGSNSRHRELVVVLRDLEHPYLTPLTFAIRTPDNGDWSWLELFRQGLRELYGSLQEFPPVPYIHLERTNSRVLAQITAYPIFPDRFRQHQDPSLYFMVMSCQNRSEDCESESAQARLQRHIRDCLLPASSLKTKSEYVHEIECLLDRLRHDGLRNEYEARWTNWPASSPGPVETLPVGKNMSFRTEGTLGVVVVGIGANPIGKWRAEVSAIKTADSFTWLRAGSGYRYTHYLGAVIGPDTRSSVGDAFAELSVLSTHRFTWQFGARAGISTGQSLSNGNRTGVWLGLQADAATQILGRLSGSLGLSFDYASARFVGPHASLLLGLPAHIWYSLTPNVPKYERGETAIDLTLEPNVDASFTYSAGMRASLGVMRAF